MTIRKRACFLLLGGVLATTGFTQESNSQERPAKPSKADAYYHFALGHLYAELASAYGNKGDYLNKAIDNYRKAIEADPDAGFLSEELSDLYIHAGRLREAVVDAETALKKNPADLNALRILGRIYTRLIGDTRQQRINEDMVKKAIEQYERITKLDPKDKDAWLLLGRLYKLAQHSVESEDAYKKVLELDDGNEDALIGLAMVYADLGDHARSAEMLQKVTGKNPSVRTLSFLAGNYEQMRQFGLAAEAYRRALDLAPGNSEIKRAVAENLLRDGRDEEALKYFQELAEENPKDYRAQLRLSQVYRQQRKMKESWEALEKAKLAKPDDLEIQYHEVNLLEADGKTDKAIDALKAILESTQKATYSRGEQSNRAIFLERLALLYRSAEQYEASVETYRQVEALDPEAAARVAANIADTLRQAKEFPRALEEIERAYKKFPNDRMVAIVRASVLADIGETDKAMAAAKQLGERGSDRETYLAQAQIYEKLRRYDLMKKVLDEAEKLSTTDEEKATVLFMRGAMHERMKNYDQSEAAFRKVLELDPDNASAMNYLGYMFADRNVRLDEAHRLISKALEYEPHNGAYLDSLGWVYYRMGRLQEAEEYLKRAVQRVSRDPIVHDHLGDVYFSQGKLREAISHWRLSLQEWKTSPAGEKDPTQVAKIQKKLEGAEIRLAKEASALSAKQP